MFKIRELKYRAKLRDSFNVDPQVSEHKIKNLTDSGS